MNSSLTCVPQSLCSWNFYVYGASLGPAEITFNFFLEQGMISFGNSNLSVQKQGWLSGRWILEENGRKVAEALKPSAFFRSYQITANGLKVDLDLRSVFTRSFNLSIAGRPSGEIRPVHAFTRRAVIDCAAAVPETLQLFSFWLVLLSWRRAARDNNAATSS